ncbi:hypothetical protein [Chromohalobacter sp. 48-RD10]|nr:hypothetical protein [Chromohalobacter sp. 48-RD10]
MLADSRHLAIFDLDGTLLDGDCTGLWIAWRVSPSCVAGFDSTGAR